MKFVPNLLAASICSAVFAASAAVSVITDGVSKGAALIHGDPAMQALLAEATSEVALQHAARTRPHRLPVAL